MKQFEWTARVVFGYGEVFIFKKVPSKTENFGLISFQYEQENWNTVKTRIYELTDYRTYKLKFGI